MTMPIGMKISIFKSRDQTTVVIRVPFAFLQIDYSENHFGLNAISEVSPQFPLLLPLIGELSVAFLCNDFGESVKRAKSYMQFVPLIQNSSLLSP